MGRRIIGLVFGVMMLGWGVFTTLRGCREMAPLDDGGLLDRVLPMPPAPRAWEVCPPDETAYAASRPAAAPVAVDVAAPWTPRQRVAATGPAFPLTLGPSGAAPRDCSPVSGATFRRFATADDFLAIASDETSTTTARAAAISELSGGAPAVIEVYCGDATVDDYQWECGRVLSAQLRIAAALLGLETRIAHDDPTVVERTPWVNGMSEVRSGVVQMGDSIVRFLELPAGVRPTVRALFAHVLAEDHTAARAYVTDVARLAPIRARLVALAARESQPEVRDALALALSRWP